MGVMVAELDGKDLLGVRLEVNGKRVTLQVGRIVALRPDVGKGPKMGLKVGDRVGWVLDAGVAIPESLTGGRRLVAIAEGDGMTWVRDPAVHT